MLSVKHQNLVIKVIMTLMNMLNCGSREKEFTQQIHQLIINSPNYAGWER